MTSGSEAVGGLVRHMIARCEALEDEASDGIATLEVNGGGEHEKGYWRGQKLTAKALRREFADLARALTQEQSK